MTALKPIENRRVRAVPSERYPINEFCASPMSDAGTKADDPHHCFPRSAIGGDSWFVEIEEDNGQITVPLPHVVGLSREQHERVERHEAWIKLEDGVWNWYERTCHCGFPNADECCDNEWTLVGPLNPQPGSRESKPRRKKLKGEERRKRKVISVRVPDDEENGGEVWDETLGDVKEKLVKAELYESAEKIPAYEAIIAGLRDWLNS